MALSTKLRNLLKIAVPDANQAKALADAIDLPVVGLPTAALDVAKLYSVDRLLLSTEILALNTTALTLLPAPGLNKIIVPVFAYAYLTYGSAQYTGANAVQIQYTNASGVVALSFTSAFLNLGANASQVANPAANLVPVVNAPLVISVPSANPAAGDSTVKIRMVYRVLPQTF